MNDPLTSPAIPIIAGHSHCVCLGLPLRSADGECRLVPLDCDDRRFCGFSSAWPRTSESWDALVRLAEGRTVILLWQGNQHNSQFLLSPGRRLDLVLAEDPELPIDSDAEIVPDLAFDERLVPHVRPLEQLVERLRSHGAARVVVAGTPPPKGDREIVRRGVLKERAFRDMATRLGIELEQIQLSEPMLMHKLWRVVQRQLRRLAVERSAEFVAVPEESLERGFLRSDLCADDATHANTAFGAMMRDRLHAHLAGAHA